MSIFEDNQILDDLIVGYCDTFGETIAAAADADALAREDYSDTNDSYFNEMEGQS